MDVDISNIYQLWIDKKDKVYFHELGSALEMNEENIFKTEKQKKRLKGMIVSKVFISNKEEFDIERMKERIANNSSLSKFDVSNVTDIVHEGYMGDAIYCVRLEKS